MPKSANKTLLKICICTVLLLIAACGGGSGTTLRVLAASSLTEAFTRVAEAVEAQNPGVKVNLDFGGSQRLRSQIQFGAKVDVFASADQRQVEILQAEDLVYGLPVTFTSNQLVLIASANGPVNAIEDLSKSGIRLVLAEENVPVGAYSRQVIANLAGDRALSLDERFEEQVLANLVSEEPNVKFVAQKVALNEVDAGIVYQTDVATAQETGPLEVIPIPLSANVKAQYPIVVLEDAPERELAQSFLKFVLSTEGQRLLAEHGFSAP